MNREAASSTYLLRDLSCAVIWLQSHGVAQSSADASFANPNDVSNMPGDFRPESRWEAVPQASYEYEFGLRDCRRCCAATADVAHDIVETVDDECGHVETAQALGTIP